MNNNKFDTLNKNIRFRLDRGKLEDYTFDVPNVSDIPGFNRITQDRNKIRSEVLDQIYSLMPTDLVFVSMHAGSEYVNKPNQFQIDFARKAIDLGAEVVIGHHPHVVQSMEKYKGKYIFYSLGNFVFDQPFSFNTKAGIMLKLNFNILGVRSVELLPYFMHNFVQPEFVEGELADKILKQLNYDFSSDLNIKPFSKLRSEYK